MAMIKCHECTKEISSSADKCPHCGVKPKKKTSLGEIIGVLLGIYFAWIIFGPGKKMDSPEIANPITAAVQQANAELSATDVHFVKDGYLSKVVGTIKNTTGRKLPYVQVEINLYDKKGTQVGSTLANVNNLEAGNNWNFEAPVMQDKAASAKVAGITKW